jgi:hypothetical protein
MSIILAVALASATAVLALATGVLIWDRNWLRRRSGARVLLHTVGDRSLEGTLLAVARDGVVLAGARYLDDELDLAREVYVPREQVAWMQVNA